MARIVQRVVSSLLSAVGLDALSEKGGLAAVLGTQRLSAVVGLVAYILIFLPVVIAALNALQMEAITVPASNMLTMILEAIRPIFGAVLVLTIAYLVGRVVSGLVANLLAGAGFNGILAKLGLGKETNNGSRTPSAIVGTLILVAIMLFAVTEAAGLIGFEVLSQLTSQFLVFAGRIVVGLVIFAIGLFWPISCTGRCWRPGPPRPACWLLAPVSPSSFFRAPWPCGIWGWRTKSSTWPSA